MSEPWEDDEFDGPVQKFMFVNRRAPYGTIYAQESLEVVLIAAALEQDVSILFLDDAVFQLVKDQDTGAIGLKNFSRTFRALEGYDVEKLYVEQESLDERGITAEDLLLEVEIVSRAQASDLMEEQDVLFSF